MSDANDILVGFGELIQAEANEKIKKAMQLFIRVDDIYKRIILHGTGFNSELTAKNLRDHFDTLELLDMIDEVIWNLEDELENS
jgi:hypothetical protein